MSYQDKYLKYKNKYLALKAQLTNQENNHSIKIVNMKGGASNVENKEVVELQEAPEVLPSEVQAPDSASKATIAVAEGAKAIAEAAQTVAESASNAEDSEILKPVENQNGGAKKSKKSKKSKRSTTNYRKHFLNDDSSISDGSSSSSSTDFSSSDLDWSENKQKVIYNIQGLEKLGFVQTK